MKYNKITPQIIDELIEIVGERNVIYDNENLEQYSHDEIAEKVYAHMPEVALKPSSEEEISKIMKLANKYLIPVTPRGAGSGLSGGAVPQYGGIVISTEKMNKILEIDKENLMIVVEPGVVTNEINDAVKEDGLFYAGYPMSVESCYVGGNIAENAGGGKAVKYGVTGRYIYGLDVVTPTGEIAHLGGKRVKDVAGYDLIHLMIGSEGTLGIFTKIYIKLMPLPKETIDLLVLFKDIDSAISMVPKIMTFGKVIPTSIEFMDAASFENSCKYLNENISSEGSGAMLLIELDGNSKDELDNESEIIGNLCMDNGAIDVYIADNATTSERMWKIRRNITDAWKQTNPHVVLDDVVVPVSKIPECMRKMQELSKKYDIPIPCYGHAGDGNLHPNPHKNPNSTLDEWYEKIPRLMSDIYKLCADLGGSVTGEHGIGNKKKPYLKFVLEPVQIEMTKRIKKALDPNLILNPGKIVDICD
ncbi:FAD-binding oxidoreductase [Clostridium sp. WLY-B-L2]|uniref:FAD-binding oxidoreductase n=1 Tax=Clostridium aromativorans TaxID=2836848 RepID=A0ABS8N653_9CLOT|nr:FAD-binding oxidoreductase [Clostridium aromativorans]MCC9295267.1 FAD-binding oxidoreductase [Clostridium aromativorans]